MATTPIDLSKLPAPAVVEALSFEAVLAGMKADLLVRDPTLGPVLALESEPLTKLIEVCAYRETVLRSRVNMAARALMPAFSGGTDLDHLASILGVTRLVLDPGDPALGVAPTLEADESLRRRFLLAPTGYSVAGPEAAYVFHALSASGEVLDATATSPGPGQVVVTVLSRTGQGVASPALLATVAATVSAENVRPLTDQVSVQSATIVPFTVVGQRWTFAGPDSGVVLAASDASLAAYLAGSHRLGRDITLSGLIAAIHVPGMQRVELSQPAANVVVTRTQAAWCTGVTLGFGGLDD